MKKFLLSLVCLLSSVAPVVAQEMPALPTDGAVRIGKLSNGLTYYIRHNEEPKNRVDFYIAQKVGSVQEEENQRGLAHFLEHMCFNGTKHFPDNRVVKWLETIGVKFGEELNAYTSTDETVYNIKNVPVSEAHIDSCLLILHDWADGLLLEEKEIDKERGVIHEEWRLRSSASGRIFERNLEKIYPGSRYGRRYPIGLMSVIDNFKPKELRDYYEKWYRPDLQGIVVVGDINVDEMEQKVKTLFGKIPAAVNPAAYEHYPVPANNEAIYVLDKDKEQKFVLLQMMFKHDPLPEMYRNTMAWYSYQLLTSMMTSAFNARLGELSQKPDCPFLQAGCYDGTFIMSKTMDALSFYILPKEGQDVAAVEAVQKEIERVRQHGFTDSELLRAREEFMSSREAEYNNREKQKNSYYTPKYVRNFLEGNPIPGIETEYQLYKMMAPQLPLAAITQMFNAYTANADTNFVFIGMYPEKEGVTVPTEAAMRQAVATARAAKLEAYVDNVKNEPLVSQLPKAGKIVKTEEADFGYTVWTLSNGARVFYKKTDFNESQIAFGARSYGGLFALNAKDLYNGRLLSDVINACGWGNFNSVELEKALAGKQVSLRASLSPYSDKLDGGSTPKDLRTLFELIYLHFQAPANDEAAYTNTINTLRTALENADKVPETALYDSIYSTLYNNNPMVKPIRKDVLNQVSYADIKRVYTERFGNIGDFDFFFTGNIDIDSLRTFTEQYLAAIPAKGKRELISKNDIAHAAGVKDNHFTRVMETPKAYIIQFWNGQQPYSMKERAIVDALGQILSQRYLKSIREEGSLAYSVSASGNLFSHPKGEYTLQIYCPVKPTKADSALLLINQGIETIATGGVTAEELDKVKKFNIKTYTDNLRDNNYWEGVITSKLFANDDDHTGYEAMMNALSPADIQNFVKNVLLQQKNVTTVVMLPADFKE